jgi:hypothetical protein
MNKLEQLENINKKAINNEYGEDSQLIKLATTVLLHYVNAGPFICGEGGDKDSMGLFEYYLICPTYGLDGFASYKKDKDYSAPGW